MQASDLATLRLAGGKLEQKVGATWQNKRWIDLDMETPDQEFILIGKPWQALASRSPKWTPEWCFTKPSLDMTGFWATPGHMKMCLGLVAYEKKVFSWWGCDGKVAQTKKHIQSRFMDFVQISAGNKFTGQILSISKLRDDFVVETKLFFLSSAGSKWVQLHSHNPGWPAARPL